MMKPNLNDIKALIDQVERLKQEVEQLKEKSFLTPVQSEAIKAGTDTALYILRLRDTNEEECWSNFGRVDSYFTPTGSLNRGRFAQNLKLPFGVDYGPEEPGRIEWYNPNKHTGLLVRYDFDEKEFRNFLNQYESEQRQLYWEKHIQPLIGQLDIDLTPWLTFMKPYIDTERIREAIKTAKPVMLSNTIHELKKIQKVVETESKQAPAETEQAETATETQQEIKATVTDLTVEDIDKLSAPLTQLKKLLEPVIPSETHKKLWQSSLRKAKKELFKEREDKIKVLICKRAAGAAASGLGSSYSGSSGPTTKPEEDVPKPTKMEVDLRALRIYQERLAKSPDYQRAVADAKAKKDAILKEIDHTLYPISEEIMKFSKAKGTLLDADYLSQIRRGAFLDVKVVDDTIDALEAIRVKVERQQQGPQPAETEPKPVKELKKKVWKAPKGYISSKTIVNEHKVPRSTLQGWQERDTARQKLKKVVKDPQTGENCYPARWFEKRFENYKARRKT